MTFQLLQLLLHTTLDPLWLQAGASGSGGPLGEEQLSQWLRQLQRLSSSGDGDTVHVLYKHLQRSQPWIRLGDVYSALVSLRDLGPCVDLGVPAGQGGETLPPLPLLISPTQLVGLSARRRSWICRELTIV